MNRSRVVLIVSATVVALGVMVALGALYFDSARAAVGPLPGEGLVLPADTQFVMGVDVKRLVASPVWERYASRQSMRPEALQKLEKWTGLDPARDIDQIVVAGRGRTGKKQAQPLVMAMGSFDLQKLGFSLDKAEGGTTSEFEGATLFTMEQKGESSSLALLDARTVLFGPTERVEAVVASRSRGETPLEQNTGLLELVASVKPGSTFWMVGDKGLLAGMPQGIPAPGMGGSGTSATMNLPPLQSLILTGDLGPQLSLALTGVAADDEAATKLADVVRGLVALMSLQAQQKPELAELASAFNISTEMNRVLISARIPYELLEALQPKKKDEPAQVTPEAEESEETSAEASPEATPE
jgi:hypothetical protein